MPYLIQFSPEADDHLSQFTARERRIVIAAIEAQLKYEPLQETRRRKRLRANPVAGWELRVGGFRVYYEVEAEPERVVYVDAIGRKIRNRVYIAGEETDLS